MTAPIKAMRFDHGELRAPVETPQGFLRVEGFVARPGIYEYINTEKDAANGHGPVGSIRRELRPEEEVFRDQTLDQFEGAPLTIRHPKQRVTKDNVRACEVGTVTARARREGDRVAVSMVIKDPAAIAKVKRGELVELSPGHETMIYKTPGADRRYATRGNPEGRYDCIQREIDINHLALCENSRGGADLRLRLDSLDDVVDVAVEHRDDSWGGQLTDAVDGHQHLISCVGYDGQALMSGTTSWAVADGAETGHEHPWVKNPDGTITIGASAGHTHAILDGRKYSAQRADARENNMLDPNLSTEEQIRLLQTQNTELAAKVTTLESDVKAKTARADAFEQGEKTAREKVLELEARISAGATAAETAALKELQTRLDAADLELAKVRDAQPDLVRKRAGLIVRAHGVLGQEFRADSLDDRAIRESIVRKLRPKDGLQISDAALEARCDSLCEDAMRNAQNLRREVIAAPETRHDAAQPNAASKPLAWRDQWMKGLDQVPGGYQKD